MGALRYKEGVNNPSVVMHDINSLGVFSNEEKQFDE
jgi:hypothetical protein